MARFYAQTRLSRDTHTHTCTDHLATIHLTHGRQQRKWAMRGCESSQSLSCCKQYLIQHLSKQATQQVTTKQHIKTTNNSRESIQYVCVRLSMINKACWEKRHNSPHSILGYLCCVVVTGRKLQSAVQIIMTTKVIQWNRPAGTDSVCWDEAGNKHHASSKEHCSEEKKGGLRLHIELSLEKRYLLTYLQYLFFNLSTVIFLFM